MTMCSVLGLSFLILGCVFTVAETQEDLTNCKNLDFDTFEQLFGSKNTFIMFYAPWCGHCKKLKPVWNDFCKDINVEGSDTIIATVDCTVESFICKKHQVKGYPTLKFFKKGESEGVKYSGARTIESFEKFIKQTLNPAAVEPEPEVEPCKVPTPQNGLLELEDCNFKQVVNEGHSLIKFYAPWCGHCKRLAPIWDQLASEMEAVPNVKIAKMDCTTQKTTCNSNDIHGYPTLYYFKDGKMIEKYVGGRDLKSFVEFLNNRVNGTVAEKEVKAKTGKGRDVDDKGEDKKNADNDKCTKSHPNDKGMWDVVDCQFEQHIAFNDAFVMFFAPWCGHCKKLMPVWEKLAESYQGYNSLRITRMDCTVNKEACRNYKVKGFPTLLYFRQGKEMDKYSGSRDFDSLKKFVEDKLEDIVVVERGVQQEKDLPRVVTSLETVDQLNVLRQNIRHTFLVIYYHSSNEQHMKEREVYHDFKDRLMRGVDVMEVDCSVSEKLCKNQNAFSDDETFVLFYMGTQVYRMDSGVKKTSDSMKGFVKKSMKKALTFIRDEL